MHTTLVRAAIYSVASVVSALCVGEETMNDDALQNLMRHFAERRHDHAAFVERQYIGILDRPTETSGELFFDAPDHLEKRTTMPRRETLILDHGTLEIRSGSHIRSLLLKENPPIAMVFDGLRQTLAGDLAALNRIFTIDFSDDSKGWTLLLIPRDPKLSGLIAKMQVRGTYYDIHTIGFERVNGDHSLMTITPLPRP